MQSHFIMKNREKKIQNTTTVRTILNSLNAMSVARIFVQIYVYCLNCTKFGQLIFRLDNH